MFNATEWEIDILHLLLVILFAICILTTRSSQVLLIVNVSQKNWLSCQIFGISKQALDFVRDANIFHPR